MSAPILAAGVHALRFDAKTGVTFLDGQTVCGNCLAPTTDLYCDDTCRAVHKSKRRHARHLSRPSIAAQKAGKPTCRSCLAPTDGAEFCRPACADRPALRPRVLIEQVLGDNPTCPVLPVFEESYPC